ncbi:type I-B CRISPR-associated endonuclease Cas1b [Arcobacter defluvii]|uniref:CRISPR-associated endonuclease Cas1 n=1 Tax=Arcobacter defluvii TaxID=873191 RepID=A0AAE7BF69_9BACT|nr:type I-B CRISPR-associated endonuclease Cas1b [Arcobacter defluvii]QKF77953.1 CRISPR/Cas system-associated endonuclease Cas1, type I-B [Arcobacter defluvii]RXI32731.1 subtype I-B CRISPR-associated endonuclease Cas1 [Arcobacter defluvii]
MAKNHTRYIFSMGELKRKDNSIAFRNEKGNFYIPVQDTREVYCMNEVSFNTKFLDFISRAGITLHLFNYHGNYSGTFYPKEQLISGDLCIKQALCYVENRLKIAKSIVQAIADNIHETLYHYYRHDKKDLKPTLDWLKSEPKKFLDKDITIEQIMFIEGQIWNKFYDSFKHFLSEDFLMNKRVKRPPDNPMNALVSFGNTLLYTKTISAIYTTHLNQAISFLHSPREGRFSLCLDISEAFKPVIVFKTIFDLVGRKQLQVEKHFDKSLNYALLNEDGKKIFIDAFETRLNETFMHPKLKRKTTYKHCLKLEGYKLIKYIVEGKEFVPFRLKDKM